MKLAKQWTSRPMFQTYPTVESELADTAADFIERAADIQRQLREEF
jgi:hypothetical protein